MTISKYWKSWSDPRLVILVLKNLDLNQVTWEQRVMNGDPKFQASQDLPDMGYAEFAKQLGLDGLEIDNAEQIGPAWDTALQAATLCEAHHLPMSSHCAPSLHLHACCAVRCLRHMEYFHDHVRIEHLLFEGAATAEQGMLRPDLSRPGLGLGLKPDQVRRHRTKF